MPDLGQTTSEAKIVSWLKHPGEKLVAGETLLEVETDKATMEVEAYVGGYLRKQLARAGEVVSASNPIAILTDTPDENFEEEGKKESVPVGSENATRKSTLGKATDVTESIAAVPAARLLAKQLGVDLSMVKGTGPRGLITPSDVERYASERKSPVDTTSLPEVRARQAMAALTSSSKSIIPHFYVTIDLDVAVAEQWRSSWNEAHPELRASVNDCLIRAASAALADSPRLNVQISTTGYEEQSSADVLLVVGTDSGLLLVAVPDPHAEGFDHFLARTKSLLNSAKEGKLQTTPRLSPRLAISNLGMFGVREFSAIIPPGCSAILAAGAIRDQVVLRNGQVEAAKICSVTVSADHRVVGGIEIAKFLERLQFHLNRL